MKAIFFRLVTALIVLVLACLAGFAGVSKEIELEYKQQYENRTVFLKQPIRGLEQTLHVRGNILVPDQSNLGSPLTFRVGEQVRVTKIDFKDSAIEFEVASTDLSRKAKYIFAFGQSLTHSFQGRPNFDSALDESFTQGLTYQDIDAAKEGYVRTQFSRQARQFTDTTGLAERDVMEAMLSENPIFNQLKTEHDQAQRRLATVEAQLKEETTTRGSLETEVREIRRQLTDEQNTNRTLRQERDQIAGRQATLQKELDQLKDANRKIQEQVESVAGNLNVQMNSNEQLGQQVSSLSETLEKLSKERNQLNTQVSSLSQELTGVRGERDRLTLDLDAAQRKVTSLQSNLSALTSNKDSLESKYVLVTQEKESLELAESLEESIVLRGRREPSDDGTQYVGDLFLLNQKVGNLVANVPDSPEIPVSATVTIDSPNTVQFSEEERHLYGALGDSVSVDLSWVSPSGNLEAVLVDGESLRSIAPREQAEWEWNLRGSPSGVEPMILKVQLINRDQHRIRVHEQDFEVGSAGLLTGLPQGFSLLSLGIGFVAGIVVLGVIASFRRGSKPGQRGGNSRRRYSASKEL